MKNLLIVMVMVSCAFSTPLFTQAGTDTSGVSCKSASRGLNEKAEAPDSLSQALASSDPVLQDLQREFALINSRDNSATRDEPSPQDLVASDPVLQELQREFALINSEAAYSRALTENSPLLRELQNEFDVLADLFSFPKKDKTGLPLPARGKDEPRMQELHRESEILRETYFFASQPEVEKIVGQITTTASPRPVAENSALLGRLADILRQTPTLIPSFLASDLTPILDALLRDRMRTSQDFLGTEKFSFDRHLKFDLKSGGNFLSVLASTKELPLLMRDDPDLALKILAISADHQVGGHHLKNSDLNFLLATSLKALPAQKINKLRPQDVYVLARNLRDLKLTPSAELQSLLYQRLIELSPQMSFRNLLAINLDLSYAGFSLNESLFEKFVEFYQSEFPWDRGALKGRLGHLQVYFFNSLAGALFNYGVPHKESDRFKELFEASGLDIFGTRIFKVQALYLFDYYVHGRSSEIMELVLRTDISDLSRPVIFKPAGKASRIEKKARSALKKLYPDKLIVREFPAHPWLPDFDLLLVESSSNFIIFEVQGPYHSRKIFEDPEDGLPFIRRQTGNSFDKGKYSILKAMGYKVIELEMEDLNGSIDDIAKRIASRVESLDEKL